MRIQLAQLNPTIGDLEKNVEHLLKVVKNAEAQNTDLVVTPELYLTGYPPRDLLDRPDFVQNARQALLKLSKKIGDTAILVGAITSPSGDPLAIESRISNSAVLIARGQILACHRKLLLPTYDVFDESRYFTPGTTPTCVGYAGTRFGLTVCEDIWNDKNYWQQPRYTRDPIAETVALGAEMLLNISASPYDDAKPAERLTMLTSLCQHHRVPLLYVNQVGGNDSLIFDGRSLAFDATGTLKHQSAAFRVSSEYIEYTNFALGGRSPNATISREKDILEALTLGLRDYVQKCGFRDVVLGLSGGIDSAVTAALAVRALGKEHVWGLALPSRFSSEGSVIDARQLAQNLGIRLDNINIEPIFSAYLSQLETPFTNLQPDLTEENLQARIRGTLLMAYSNKFGSLLLTTGNKSEIAVGYCTLYGDMCGGLGVLGDVYKTDVYKLAEAINAEMHDVIPRSSIEKAPSAELRANQTDQQSLPPYDVLDAVLRMYIDGQNSMEQIISAGHSKDIVRRILTLVDRAEYKRHQMATSLRISRKAFGEGRRIPIAQKYVY